ncbi:hypothetical protein [Streptomyces sp. NPDC000134]|uniref:hypothetical protein n=1 Tax=Streptomyces sp. NPDC000134 TaxID=3364536 RepID=UPI0036C33608
MADEQDRWLDRETAELLLRGEPLEAVDPAVRDRAERLASALAALSAPTPPTSGELPGEAAALAAFREARAESSGAPDAVSGTLGRGAPRRALDAGPVRIGGRDDDARRPRRTRPLRLGLAAALTAGMVGGAGIAAATGALPTPFGDRGAPDPAASVSTAATPGRPLSSPSPRTTAPRDEAGTGRGTGAPGAADAPGERDRADACRDIRAGKERDALREHALRKAADGPCEQQEQKQHKQKQHKQKQHKQPEKTEKPDRPEGTDKKGTYENKRGTYEKGKGAEGRDNKEKGGHGNGERESRGHGHHGGSGQRDRSGSDDPDAGDRADAHRSDHRPAAPHTPSDQHGSPRGKKSSARE